MNRDQVVSLAKKIISYKPVYLDTETTGIGEDAQIIDIAIVDYDGKVLLDTLVCPMGEIPQQAIDVHGITNEMVSNAPYWDEVWPLVQAMIENRGVGIYNSKFDLRLIEQSSKLQGFIPMLDRKRVFCIMKLYADFYGEIGDYDTPRWQSLGDAIRQCDLEIENTHRALSDALAARAVLEYMGREL